MSSLRDADLVLTAAHLCKTLQYMSDPGDINAERFYMEWRDNRLYMVA